MSGQGSSSSQFIKTFNYQESWQCPSAIQRADPESEVGAGGDSWIWQLLILPVE